MAGFIMGSTEKMIRKDLVGTGHRENDMLVWIFSIIYSIFLAAAIILLFIDV